MHWECVIKKSCEVWSICAGVVPTKMITEHFGIIQCLRSEVRCNLVQFLQVVEDLSWRGANLLGKVRPLLEAELWVRHEEISVQDVALRRVQVLVARVEHAEGLRIESGVVGETVGESHLKHQQSSVNLLHHRHKVANTSIQAP